MVNKEVKNSLALYHRDTKNIGNMFTCQDTLVDVYKIIQILQFLLGNPQDKYFEKSRIPTWNKI